MVFAAGVGPRPCPIAQLTHAKLAEAFAFLRSVETQIAAEMLSQNMKAEDGIEAAYQVC